MTFPVVLLMFLLGLYGLLVLCLLTGLLRPLPKHTMQSGSVPNMAISVVIPFRNEADNLATLLKTLADQDHTAPWEILLVNDGSTDGWEPIVDSCRGALKPSLTVLNLTVDPSEKLTSKQQAIEAGIKAAKYPLVALTDADMTFQINWLRSLVEASAGADMVFGRTEIILQDGRFLSRLQGFQLDFLFCTAYAFQRAGFAGSCMGNNLLIRKEAFTAAGGFARLTGYSIVEDLDLLAAFRRRRLKIRTVEPFHATASTLPAPGLRAFADQVARWSRGGFAPHSVLLPVGLLLAFENGIFILALAGFIYGPPALLCFVNMLLTVFFASVGLSRIQSRETVLFFPAWYLFLLVQTILFPLFFLWRPRVLWKGRSV